jgi:hypothetical protein
MFSETRNCPSLEVAYREPEVADGSLKDGGVCLLSVLIIFAKLISCSFSD